jgi:hypothetical protein
MNDEELRRLLQNSLSGRRMPEEVRARVWSRARRRPRAWAWGAAALALLGILGPAFLLARRSPLPPLVALAIEQHHQAEIKVHAVASATVAEITGTINEATGLKIQLPGLRDAGFGQVEAHRCSVGSAHVVYANSWNKLSCFIFDAETFPSTGGERVADQAVDGTVYTRGNLSAVAIREGGVVKLWISDLRADKLTLIAVDAEQKRYQLRETVLEVANAIGVRPALLAISGVEDVEFLRSGQAANVRYDPRRVSPDEILAFLLTNGIDVREGSGR